MILKNKLTKETLDISYSEFRIKFAKEIQNAFESFKRTELNKTFYNFHIFSQENFTKEKPLNRG